MHFLKNQSTAEKMTVEQIYTGCLAQGAYYIVSNGEAAIIDPLREVSPYMERAQKDGVQIKYVFETHFHADFVSGHLSLSEKTGAPIVYGPNANPKFDAIIAKDGQVFQIGNITITALHTPGHTMESTTFLLKDESGTEQAIFTGDTLFLGDVGRPDLAQKAADMSREQLAEILYDSLRNKIMTLPKDLTVYPGHGAGSACGKNMMKETVDTLENQLKVNYALRADMTKSEFVEELLDGLAEPPAYFPLNVKMNKEGYKHFDQVLEKGLNAISAENFESLVNSRDILMLDVRHQSTFMEGHIPNSIFIGLSGGFAPWVGALVKDTEQEIILIADAGQEEEAITRLSRVGFDNVIGYLDGGFDAWKASGKDFETIETMASSDVAALHADSALKIFDVRKPGEFTASHVEGAVHTPLSTINEHLSKYGNEEKQYVHCRGGYRSVIAISILKARGIHNLVNITEGFDQMEKENFNFNKTCQN
jgi:hydroxyacylglutathione hydrolase